MKKNARCRFTALALALLCTLALCACEQEPEKADQRSTSMANLLMGGGRYAYRDGFIYFADSCSLYEYDTETGVTVQLVQGSGMGTYYDNLFVDDERVYYSYNGLHYITRDGKEQGTVFGDENTGLIYADENDLYHLDLILQEDGWDNILLHRDMETGVETELVGHLSYNCFYVDDEYIYATIAGEHNQTKENTLMRSRRDKIAFEKVPLSCSPYYTIPTEDGIYMTAFRKNLVHYRDGVETELPFLTSTFQVVGDAVYYISKDKSSTRSESCAPLMRYDLKTGETATVHHSVFSFAFLNGDRYLCYWQADYTHQQWYLYDLTTGETTLMYEIPDSSAAYGYAIG